MAQVLHSQMAWEELAEDPFRGLRAGPATFSPFLFLPTAFLQRVQSGCCKTQVEKRAEARTPTEEKTKNTRVASKWKSAAPYSIS